MLSETFFVDIPAAFYKIFRLFNFFVFDYTLFGSSSQSLEYRNPFDRSYVDLDFVNLGSFDLVQIVIDFVEDLLNISISNITFFELLTGPLLIFCLGFALIKYLNPSNI